MVVAVALFAKDLVFEGMTPGGVITLLTGVELVKLVGRKRHGTKEGVEEDL